MENTIENENEKRKFSYFSHIALSSKRFLNLFPRAGMEWKRDVVIDLETSS